MVLQSLTMQISFWVRTNLRDESSEEYRRNQWPHILKSLKPYKYNWTKAVNAATVSIEYQEDLLRWLLEKQFVTDLGWVS